MTAPTVHRIEIDPAEPPARLLTRLDDATLCALDAAAPDGWASPPGIGGRSLSALALAPTVSFAGGVEALSDAERWLRETAGGAARSASLFGALSYDLGRAISGAPTRFPGPLVSLLGFRAVYRYDPATGRGWIGGGDATAVRELANRVRGAIAELRRASCGGRPNRCLLAWPEAPPVEAARFRADVERIRDWIRRGDVYQVNLTRRVDLPPIDARAARSLYAALVEHSPAPFCALLATPELQLVSNSPERFLRRVGERVETCPIKGTRPRGATPERDRALAKELRSAVKDAAEHLMIVDLERNDLGRIARTGSVRVNRLAELRSFANVHHLVSSVSAEVDPRLALADLLGATYPGGSITGAPKIRAMQIIEQLEPVPRGFYTGAIGEIDGGGGVDLSLAIRTAVTLRGASSLHVGGGIVWDSDPDDEWLETEHKAAAFRRILEGARWPSG